MRSVSARGWMRAWEPTGSAADLTIDAPNNQLGEGENKVIHYGVYLLKRHLSSVRCGTRDERRRCFSPFPRDICVILWNSMEFQRIRLLEECAHGSPG